MIAFLNGRAAGAVLAFCRCRRSMAVMCEDVMLYS